MSSLQAYSTWVFDCDGVLLHSNRVKTDAFYRAAEPYGTDKARALVDYHISNGGISRYIKFRTFLSDIVGREQVDEEELDTLLQCYAGYVWEGLLSCEVAQGLERLRALTPRSSWLVVSGGDQAELRAVFSERGLAEYFDGASMVARIPRTKSCYEQSSLVFYASLRCFWVTAAMTSKRRPGPGWTSCS